MRGGARASLEKRAAPCGSARGGRALGIGHRSRARASRAYTSVMSATAVAESENGGLVFNSLGTVGFSLPGDAASFPPPPGYAKLVAASSLYGLTCFADHAGLCAIPTADLAEVTESPRRSSRTSRSFPPTPSAAPPCAACRTSPSPPTRPSSPSASAPSCTYSRPASSAPSTPPSPPSAPRPSATTTTPPQRIRDLRLAPSPHELPRARRRRRGRPRRQTPRRQRQKYRTDRPHVHRRARPGNFAGSPSTPRVRPSSRSPPTAASSAAKLADGGYSAQMKPIPVGPIDDGEVEVVIDGVAFGPRPGLVLILATHFAEDAEAHQPWRLTLARRLRGLAARRLLRTHGRLRHRRRRRGSLRPLRTPRPSRSGGWRDAASKSVG